MTDNTAVIEQKSTFWKTVQNELLQFGKLLLALGLITPSALFVDFIIRLFSANFGYAISGLAIEAILFGYVTARIFERSKATVAVLVVGICFYDWFYGWLAIGAVSLGVVIFTNILKENSESVAPIKSVKKSVYEENSYDHSENIANQMMLEQKKRMDASIYFYNEH